MRHDPLVKQTAFACHRYLSLASKAARMRQVSPGAPSQMLQGRENPEQRTKKTRMNLPQLRRIRRSRPPRAKPPGCLRGPFLLAALAINFPLPLGPEPRLVHLPVPWPAPPRAQNYRAQNYRKLWVHCSRRSSRLLSRCPPPRPLQRETRQHLFLPPPGSRTGRHDCHGCVPRASAASSTVKQAAQKSEGRACILPSSPHPRKFRGEQI